MDDKFYKVQPGGYYLELSLDSFWTDKLMV